MLRGVRVVIIQISAQDPDRFFQQQARCRTGEGERERDTEELLGHGHGLVFLQSLL